MKKKKQVYLHTISPNEYKLVKQPRMVTDSMEKLEDWEIDSIELELEYKTNLKQEEKIQREMFRYLGVYQMKRERHSDKDLFFNVKEHMAIIEYNRRVSIAFDYLKQLKEQRKRERRIARIEKAKKEGRYVDFFDFFFGFWEAS